MPYINQLATKTSDRNWHTGTTRPQATDRKGDRTLEKLPEKTPVSGCGENPFRW